MNDKTRIHSDLMANETFQPRLSNNSLLSVDSSLEKPSPIKFNQAEISKEIGTLRLLFVDLKDRLTYLCGTLPPDLSSQMKSSSTSVSSSTVKGGTFSLLEEDQLTTILAIKEIQQNVTDLLSNLRV